MAAISLVAIWFGGKGIGYRCASLSQMNAFTRHCSSNFHIELPTFIFHHEQFSCRERITFMQTALFYKHLDADHFTEVDPKLHAQNSITLRVFTHVTGVSTVLYSLTQGGREEVDVGFNLLKIQQLIFCLVIYNRWFWVAFLGANMFEVHRGQTVSFIHQRGGTITNSVRLVIG